jgi:quercetin dioxygenase-like cupin family protein
MIRKVSDQDTGGAYSLFENWMPPQSPGPLPHIHFLHDEVFYVLEGELTVRVGRQTLSAPVGSFVLVPHGVVHRTDTLPDEGYEPVMHLVAIGSVSG